MLLTFLINKVEYIHQKLVHEKKTSVSIAKLAMKRRVKNPNMYKREKQSTGK